MGSVKWKPQTEIFLENEQRAWYEVRSLRNQKIEAVEWARRRHLDELELGLQTTLTEEQYRNLLGYIQELRDVPQVNSDPFNVTWPELIIPGL